MEIKFILLNFCGFFLRKKKHLSDIKRKKKLILQIQRITMDYYKQLYINKLGDLKEIEIFPEIWNLTRLNHEELEI